MTTGVYKLTFAPGVEYVGKAIDIETRWDEHASSFLRNKAAAKMMAAYKQYGYPDGEILATCHKDHIDFMECYYIDRMRPKLNTQVCDSISDEDFEIVQDNLQLLGYSTIDHLRIMSQESKTIGGLEDELADAQYKIDVLQQDFDEKHAALQAVMDMKDQERRFEHTLHNKDLIINQLQSQLELSQRPWYKKLLG